MSTIQTQRVTYWFYLFLLVHVLCWTLAPFLLRYTLPLDSMEGTTWGHQLLLGYDKNPFMNAWLTALAIKISGTSAWAVYLFSQLSVGLCFWAVWKLGLRIFSPLYACVSVMLLEGVQYYHLHAIDFNDNTLELSLWALTIYFFYCALRDKNFLSWLLTGIFAALGVMTKYYTAVLLLPMMVFLLIYKENRTAFKSRYFYFSLLVFLIIIAPHFIWLCFNNFITIEYAFNRVDSLPHWSNHFTFPAQFAWEQIQTFLPCLILSLPLLIGRGPLRNETTISAFNRSFLLFMGLGPFVVTLLLSLIFGMKLRAGWGMPLLSFWGILFIAYLRPAISLAKFNRFVFFVFLSMALVLTGYSLALKRAARPSSANFPGREISAAVTQQWHEKYHTPLAYVAGPRWIAGNVSFYSPDRPTVFMGWDSKRTTWINLADMRKKGAVFIWQISEDESLPEEVRQQYPNLVNEQVLRFQWHRNKDLPVIELGVIFLPPTQPLQSEPRT